MQWLTGEDGEFSRFEKARAYVVYPSAIILTPVFWHIAYHFIVTRRNYEMQIRNPNVVILMSIMVWIWMILRTIEHLVLDLDLDAADDDWSFNEQQKEKNMEVFRMLSWICFTVSFSCYFYRVWLFWYRIVAAGEATNFGERRTTGLNSAKFFYTRHRRWFGNPKVVFFVCFLWFCTATIPVLNEYFLSGKVKKVRFIVQYVASFPLLLVEVVLLKKVKNLFGVIVEYKMLLIALVLDLLCSGSLEFIPTLKDSYYKYLIQFMSTTYIICAYFLWLKYFIRSYAIKYYDKPICCPSCCSSIWCGRRMMGIVRNSFWKRLDKYSLADVLGSKEYYEQFSIHLRQSLAIENLLFVVDIYKLRKTLEHDPFLDLCAGEVSLIRNCVKAEMKWIDEEILDDPESIPSSQDIYYHYIKPLSVMEVNIPGNMRREISAKFEEPLPKLTRWVTIKKGRHTPGNSMEMIGGHNIFSRPNTREISGDIFNSKESIDSQKSQIESEGNESISPEPSVIDFYNAWKNVVFLLNNDSLVRFKSCGCGGSILVC
jgi:hypothetical protein